MNEQVVQIRPRDIVLERWRNAQWIAKPSNGFAGDSAYTLATAFV